MHRSKSRTPNYLRPTASSVAHRHPRAAKLAETQRSSLRSYLSGKAPLRRTQSCLTDTRGPNYMKDTVSSRAKQKGKMQRGTSLKGQLDVERCQMKRPKRSPFLLSDVRSLGDSALNDASGIERSETMKEVPEIVDDVEMPKSFDAAAIALLILFRMNKPRAVRDFSDIVVAINRKKRKMKQNTKRKLKAVMIKRKLTQAIPGLGDLLECIRGLSFSSLLQFVHRKAFVIAFPFLLLQLVAQFPSLLNAIFSAVRAHWRHAFITDQLYCLHALVGYLLPLPSFPSL